MSTPWQTPHRFEQVILYIEQHLDQPLDTRLLADLGHYAYFHFHHRFAQHANEPVWQLVKRLRLERAAYLLSYTQMPVVDVADQVGYGSSASLSKAFRAYYGSSPRTFRHRPKPQVSPDDARFLNDYESPRIIRLTHQELLFVRTTGASRHQQAWQQISSLLSRDSALPARLTEPALLGKTPDIPGLTPAAKLRYDLGLVLPTGLQSATLPKTILPVMSQPLPGGKYAVVTHQGPVDTLARSFHALFNQWLVEGGYQLRHAPWYQRYQPTAKSDGDGPPDIDIYLPIE